MTNVYLLQLIKLLLVDNVKDNNSILFINKSPMMPKRKVNSDWTNTIHLIQMKMKLRSPQMKLLVAHWRSLTQVGPLARRAEMMAAWLQTHKNFKNHKLDKSSRAYNKTSRKKSTVKRRQPGMIKRASKMKKTKA